jgi:hypothetical protein
MGKEKEESRVTKMNQVLTKKSVCAYRRHLRNLNIQSKNLKASKHPEPVARWTQECDATQLKIDELIDMFGKKNLDGELEKLNIEESLNDCLDSMSMHHMIRNVEDDAPNPMVQRAMNNAREWYDRFSYISDHADQQFV